MKICIGDPKKYKRYRIGCVKSNIKQCCKYCDIKRECRSECKYSITETECNVCTSSVNDMYEEG